MAGLDMEWVVGLDLLSFDSLIGSLDREKAREEYQSVINTRLAMNGDEKAMKAFVKYIEKRLLIKPANEASNLIKDIGTGI